jgi:hypothetical protein
LQREARKQFLVLSSHFQFQFQFSVPNSKKQFLGT